VASTGCLCWLAAPQLLAQTTSSDGAAQPEPVNVHIEAGVMRDNNATRAGTGTPRMADTVGLVGVTTSLAHPLTQHSRLWITGVAGAEHFRRFDGLGRVYGSAEVEYQYRASSRFDEPTFGAFAKFTGEEFDSNMRDGYRISAGVSARQTLTDRISYSAAFSHNVRRASDRVFTGSENALRGNLDVLLTNRAALYLGAEYRRGDIVSTGWPMGPGMSPSDVFWWDDAFMSQGLVSYRLRGTTVLLTVGLNYALAPRHSIDFSWRQIRTRAADSPRYVASELTYKTDQFSVVYLYRF
jgi:opacity protein-like surface antigen